MLTAEIAAACLAIGGCGGTSPGPTTPTHQAKIAAPSDTTPRQPYIPTIDSSDRAALAGAGLTRPIPTRLRRACAKTAASTTWLVICPPFVPSGALVVVAVSGAAANPDDFTEGYEININSPSIRATNAPDPGHWTIGAGTPAAMHEQLTAFGHSAPLDKRELKVGRVTVTRFQEPPYTTFHGVYGGHTVYQWNQGKATMHVTAHGTYHDRMLRALVRTLSRAPDPTPGASDGGP
jgi:hypothetical protein